MIITKEWLQEQRACAHGIKWFLGQTKTDSIEVLDALMRENKLSDANWLVVRLMAGEEKIKYAIFAVEQVLHIFENKYPKNKKLTLTIEAAKKVLENDTEENRNAYAYTAYAYATAAAAAYAADDDAGAARREMTIRIINYGKELLSCQN